MTDGWGPDIESLPSPALQGSPSMRNVTAELRLIRNAGGKQWDFNEEHSWVRGLCPPLLLGSEWKGGIIIYESSFCTDRIPIGQIR